MIDYQNYKNATLKLTESFIEFAKKSGYAESANIIAEDSGKLKQDQIMIMSCGEARMGKSSMLGALLEDGDLFPVDVDITTCLITVVSYAPQEKVIVVLKDDQGKSFEKEITRNEIAAYAKEQNNRHNHKKAQVLKIQTPNPKLKDGLVFVDSPGIGSMNIEHSELTYQFLPQADLVLFVSDSAKPYTAPEIAFMRNTHQLCSNMLFVLTKKDMQHQASILESMKQTIEDQLDLSREEMCFVPISSRQKLQYLATQDEDWLEDSNFLILEAEIKRYIEKNRANVMIIPRLVKLGNELQKIKEDIFVKETSFSEDKDKVDLLKQELTELSAKRQMLLSDSANWRLEVTNQVNGLGVELDYSIASFQTSVLEDLKEKVLERQYFNAPERLLNETVCLIQQQVSKMERIIHEKVESIREHFEAESGLTYTLDEVVTNFPVNNTTQVVFEKTKTINKLIAGGGKMGQDSFRMTAVGTFAGAVLGGVLGFFIGGPAGVIGFGKAGAMTGGTLAGAAGTAIGAGKALQSVGNYDSQEIYAIISKYVMTNIAEWRKNKQLLMQDVSKNATLSLNETVKESQRMLDEKIKTLQNNAGTSGEQRKAALEKLAVVKKQYGAYVASLDKLLNVQVQAMGVELAEASSEEPMKKASPKPSEKPSKKPAKPAVTPLPRPSEPPKANQNWIPDLED